MQDYNSSEVIQMAWCDKTSFEDITFLTGLSEPEVIKIMRSNLKRSSFKMWRKRVYGRSLKHRVRSNAKKMH
jgi:uncharacterized protein (TIGR03643 family)